MAREDFQRFSIDDEHGELSIDGSPVRLGAKAFAIARMLIEAQGAIVGRQDMLGRVWPTVPVEANTLDVHVTNLRKAIREFGMSVDSIRGAGYRLTISDPKENVQDFLRPFIGRTREMASLLNMIDANSLITIVGPGGVGKSALARAVFGAIGQSYACYLWDLDEREPGQALRSEMTALVARAISSPSHSPLVLFDNVDLHREDVLSTIDELLAMRPDLRLVLTCRAPLGLEDEEVFRLQPFPKPGELGDMPRPGECPSRQTFISYYLREGGAPLDRSSVLDAVEDICLTMDSVPIAIELAANYAAHNGIAALLSLLNKPQGLMQFNSDHGLPRHRNIAALMDWTVDSVTADERSVLQVLAEVSGDASPADISSRFAQHPQLPAWDAIAGLVQKSLLHESRNGTTSYRLLRHVRAWVSAARWQ